MERRAFLRSLLTGFAGAVVGAELDVDRLLWVPGQKTIFIPSEPLETFEHADWLAVEALKVLEKNLSMTKFFNREYTKRFETFNWSNA